jgi:hypothetical protein
MAIIPSVMSSLSALGRCPCKNDALAYTVRIVLAVNGVPSVRIEGRDHINGGSTWLHAGLSLRLTGRQESRKDTLVGIREEDAGGLVWQISLVLSNLCLCAMSGFCGSVHDDVVCSQDRELVDLWNARQKKNRKGAIGSFHDLAQEYHDPLLRNTKDHLLVEPMAKRKRPGLLLRLPIDYDHFGVLDVKYARAQRVMESVEPRRQGALHGELLWNLCRRGISQSLVDWITHTHAFVSIGRCCY